jgi:hypothetical protein
MEVPKKMKILGYTKAQLSNITPLKKEGSYIIIETVDMPSELQSHKLSDTVKYTELSILPTTTSVKRKTEKKAQRIFKSRSNKPNINKT